MLVGHSGGGSIIAGAADARPDRVEHAMYVDTGPIGEGGVINDELPVESDEVPFPGWEAFEEPELVDMTPEIRAHFEQIAIPEPAGVARDPQHVGDERRYSVPSTVIACSMLSVVLEKLMADDHPYMRELASMKDRTIIDLSTGHWPQLTKPAELAAEIVGIVEGLGAVGQVALD